MRDQQENYEAGTCELCGRRGVILTRHHLIPRTRHRSKSARKRFNRKTMTGEILQVCRPCHNQIHIVFSEKELEREYNTLESLLESEDLQRFIRWIKKRPAGFKPGSRRARSR